MHTKEEGLYLGWRWSQASGAVASQSSDEAMLCRQTRNADEENRGRRVPSDVLFSTKEETQYYKLKISAEPPLYGEVSKTYKKKASTMADSIYMARRPTHPRTT